jgi:hypothetical protein
MIKQVMDPEVILIWNMRIMILKTVIGKKSRNRNSGIPYQAPVQFEHWISKPTDIIAGP